MPRITRFTSADVSAPDQTTVGQNIDIPRGAFGELEAEAIAQLGGTITNTAEALGMAAYRKKQRDDADAVVQAETALNEFSASELDNYYSQQGRHAVGAEDTTKAAFGHRVKDIRDSLQNEEQREAFDQIAARSGISFNRSVGNHRRTQLEKARSQETAAALSSSRDNVLVTRNDAEAQAHHLDRMKSIIYLDAMRKGLGADVADVNYQKVVSDTHKDAVSLYVADEDLQSAQQYLKDNKESMLQTDIADAENVVGRLESVLNRRAVQDIKSDAALFSKKAELGVDTPDQAWDGLIERAKAADDTALAENISRTKDTVKFKAGYSSMPSFQDRKAVRDGLEKSLEDGTGDDVLLATQLAEANKMEAKLYKLAKDDPIQYGVQTGLITAKTVDFSDPESIRARENDINAVSAVVGGTEAWLTDEEFSSFKKRYDAASPAQRLSFLGSMAEHAPSTSAMLFKQMDKKGFSELSYVSSMATAGGNFASIAENVLIGEELLKSGAVKKLTSTERSNVLLEVNGLEEALSFYSKANPKMLPTVLKTAEKYAAAVSQTSEDLASNVGQGVLAVLGHPNLSKLPVINGVRTITPPGVGEQEFERFLERLAFTDLTELSKTGAPPVFANGTRVTIDDIEDEATFRLVGPSQYLVIMKQDGRHLVDENGMPYIMNITKEDVGAK